MKGTLKGLNRFEDLDTVISEIQLGGTVFHIPYNRFDTDLVVIKREDAVPYGVKSHPTAFNGVTVPDDLISLKLVDCVGLVILALILVHIYCKSQKGENRKYMKICCKVLTRKFLFTKFGFLKN